ncbi:MAG: prepilin peptidase [Methylacidiphilales bacterium]|nr:prepilin peptidase [Candidatus Methylacidiphilales bacterium]
MDPSLQRNLEAFFAFGVGACIGSFINVCVYRIPLNRSVVSPGSHCSACGAPIPWYHNVPIFSWLVLRGRAACCGTRIDLRYWLVELGMAFLFMALWLRYGPTDPVAAVIYAIMISGLTAACLIDLDHYIIPDRFSLGGCVAGFIACTIHPSLMGQTSPLKGFSWSLAGAIAGALTLIAIAWLGTMLFKKEAMGMGDVKLLAALCSFLGGTSITWILPLSSGIGAILGVTLIVWQRGAWGTRIPYGPFLGLAAILWLFGGSDFTFAYWHNVSHTWNMSQGPMIDERMVNPGR